MNKIWFPPLGILHCSEAGKQMYSSNAMEECPEISPEPSDLGRHSEMGRLAMSWPEKQCAGEEETEQLRERIQAPPPPTQRYLQQESIRCN